MSGNVKKPIYKRPWFIVICVVFVIGIIGSAIGDSDDASQGDNELQSVSSTLNESESEVDTEDEFDLEAHLGETEQLLQEMQPKADAIEARMAEIIPDQYDDGKWFDVTADIYDRDIFTLMIQVNVDNDDVEEAKSLAVNLHRMLIPLEEELDFICDGYSIRVVNDGSSVAWVMSSEEVGTYFLIHDGRREEFTAEPIDDENGEDVSISDSDAASVDDFSDITVDAQLAAGEEVQAQQTDTIVYITNTGGKYHRSSCRHLADSKIETTLTSAKTQGYDPCGTCRPPS